MILTVKHQFKRASENITTEKEINICFVKFDGQRNDG